VGSADRLLLVFARAAGFPPFSISTNAALPHLFLWLTKPYRLSAGVLHGDEV
jgi:hypothetical protein